MIFTKLRAFAIALILTLSAGLPGPSWAAQLTLNETPLFLNGRIKPAFIMAVDNSGSMTFETLFPTQDGQGFWENDNRATNGFFTSGGAFNTSGDEDQYHHVIPTPGHRIATTRWAIPPLNNYGFARSPDYNPAYFNPDVTYSPWKNFDGTDFANATPAVFLDASVLSVRVDPRNATPTIQLFSNVRDRSDDADTTPIADEMFRTQNGMVLPTGTTYFITSSCGGLGTTNGTRNTWVQLTANTTVTAACDVGIEYFPAVFFRPKSVPAPTGFITANRINAVNAGGPGVDLWKYEIKPTNYTAGLVDPNYLAAVKNFANWFSFYGDRNRAIVAALTRSLSDVEFMRVGYVRINNLVTVAMRDMDKSGTQRSLLYTDILGLNASGGTPNRQAVDYVGQQFGRRVGAGDLNPPIKLACQVNAAMLFTDGFSNGGGPTVGNTDSGMGAPFADTNSNTMADIASKYYLNTAGGKSPLVDDTGAGGFIGGQVRAPRGCSISPVNPRLDCQTNLHMNFYGVTLGAKGNIFGVNAAQTANPFPPTTQPPWPTRQDDNPSTVDDIWHATLNTRGKFINASSPQAVSDAMRDVLNSVLDSAQDSGTQSLAGARIDAGTFTVSPSFKVGNNGTDWTGDLTALRINTDGSIGSQLWSATSLLPAPASRNILMTTTPGKSGTHAAASFSDSNLGVTELNKLAKLGLTVADVALLFPGATAAQIVSYLRGDTTREIRNGGLFRDRSTVMGDIVASVPEIATPKDDFGYGFFPGTLGTSYKQFVKDKSTGANVRKPIVYVGANDGMLHAFNGETGVELFGYIPSAVIGKMGQLANKRYAHTYFVDGQVSVSDVSSNAAGSWSTMLIGAAGAGGKTVYGLDVTTVGNTAMAANKVLWEFNASDATNGNDLGFVFAKPLVVPVKGSRWVALVPNGYNSVNEDPVLFVLDAVTGQVIKSLKPSLASAQDDNGLGQVVATDDDGDGYADTVYGGDLKGNIWKFDISNASAASWTVAYGNQPVFTAKDSSNVAQPITGGFQVSAGPGGQNMLFFGTGRYLVASDATPTTSSQVQSVYAVVDTGATGTLRANLQQQSITRSGVVAPSTFVTRDTSSNIVDYSVKKGWFMDLIVAPNAPADHKGEMFIGTPLIQSSTIFFTTFEPQGDECSPGGKNWLYGLSTLTGISRLGGLQAGVPTGSVVCTGNCGGVAIAPGSPVPTATASLPQRACRPGVDPGCSVPVSCDPTVITVPPCVPLDENTLPPPPPAGGSKCAVVISAQGSPQFLLNRPCGRQSWRQVR